MAYPEFISGSLLQTKDRNTLSINVRTIVAGGRRYTPYLLDESIVAGKGVHDLANTFAAQASNY